jgi:hypothetical protein
MKKCLIIILLILLNEASNAQFVENRFNLYMSYSFGNFYGQEVLRDGSFIAPSLYSGNKSVTGINIKGLYIITPVLSIGAAVDYIVASDWQSIMYTDYIGSKTTLYSILPVIQFHNRFSEKGLFNCLTLVVEISPSFGSSELSMSQPIFDIYVGGSKVTQLMKKSDLFYGLSGSLGIEYSINQVIGLSIDYSVINSFIQSKLYSDTRFFYSQLQFGAFIKFKKDKRYYY